MSDKLIYTARVRTTGGREGGTSRSDDGRLVISHSLPGTGTGTNPEQLLAAGWSGCFEGAMGIAAKRMGIVLPRSYTIDAEIDLKHGASGYLLGARLNVSISGLESAVAQTIVDAAFQICPYSKALRGSIDTMIRAV